MFIHGCDEFCTLQPFELKLYYAHVAQESTGQRMLQLSTDSVLDAQQDRKSPFHPQHEKELAAYALSPVSG